MNKDFDYIYKIVIIGDSGVGKTNLILRYVKDEFAYDNAVPTIGAEFSTRIINLENKRIKVQIWDTSGSERYRSVTNTYYKGALGALLVFDITKRVSFINAARWLEDLRNEVSSSTVIILVGNKSDLEDAREVEIEEAEEFAEKNNLLYAETSACKAINVLEVFETIIEEIYKTLLTNTIDQQYLNAALPNSEKKSILLTQVPTNKDPEKTNKGCC